MNGGFYVNNGELPTMTRSEYIAEYYEITTYFDEEKVRIKKNFPFFLILAIINVIIEILTIVLLIPIVFDDPFINYRKEALAAFMLLGPCVLSLPLGSLIIRKIQIRKKEKHRFAELENRKKICVELGTYDVEK